MEPLTGGLRRYEQEGKMRRDYEQDRRDDEARAKRRALAPSTSKLAGMLHELAERQGNPKVYEDVMGIWIQIDQWADAGHEISGTEATAILEALLKIEHLRA